MGPLFRWRKTGVRSWDCAKQQTHLVTEGGVQPSSPSFPGSPSSQRSTARPSFSHDTHAVWPVVLAAAIMGTARSHLRMSLTKSKTWLSWLNLNSQLHIFLIFYLMKCHVQKALLLKWLTHRKAQGQLSGLWAKQGFFFFFSHGTLFFLERTSDIPYFFRLGHLGNIFVNKVNLL